MRLFNVGTREFAQALDLLVVNALHPLDVRCCDCELRDDSIICPGVRIGPRLPCPTTLKL